ncbi:hypothetical protein [Gordonia paraffinivorans]|uniref:hypothetical protein n=1 Tax=Gordonia paraffinivorans TaxID=175628 RepID=UPI001C6362B0|nr:hypothetical protein [Gordonia paraffinivorans]
MQSVEDERQVLGDHRGARGVPVGDGTDERRESGELAAEDAMHDVHLVDVGKLSGGRADGGHRNLRNWL